MNLVDALDDVLARVAAGEPLEGCLTRYASHDWAAELTEMLGARNRLSALGPVPALPADVLAARRRQFLATARTYKRQATSAHPRQPFIARAWPAFAPSLARAAIALVLVLSILGGTAAAAQSSLPDSPLYSIKLTVEDARLNLTRDPWQEATLALAFASERAREMEQLALAQRPIGALVPLRLQSQLETALSAAARAPEPEMLRLLDQVRVMAQTQERTLAQVQVQAPHEASTQDALRLAGEIMAQARQQAELGLTDPNVFRDRYRHRQGQPEQPTPQPPTPTATAQPTTTLEATRTPEPWHTPQATVTPQRTRAGTGQPPTSAPGPHVTATPRATGPGPQPTAGQGSPGPRATDKPGDGTGSGGGGGSDGGTGGNGGSGTRRP